MTSIGKLKSFLFPSLEERYKEYKKIEDSLLALEKEKQEAIILNHNTREEANTNISKAISPELEGRITEKYNDYFSDFIDTLHSLNVKIESLRLEKATKLKDTGLRKIVNGLSKHLDLESKGDFKYLKYLPSTLGRKRETLPQINADNYDDIIIHFEKRAKIKKITKLAKELIPVQDSLENTKVLGIYKDRLFKNYPDQKYFISKDNYFVDGHHNWAADLEEDENKPVTCYQIDLPIVELLRRLNIMKVTTKGEPISSGAGEEIKKAVTTILLNYKLGNIEKEVILKTKEKLEKSEYKEYASYFDNVL